MSSTAVSSKRRPIMFALLAHPPTLLISLSSMQYSSYAYRTQKINHLSPRLQIMSFIAFAIRRIRSADLASNNPHPDSISPLSITWLFLSLIIYSIYARIISHSPVLFFKPPLSAAGVNSPYLRTIRSYRLPLELMVRNSP